MKKIIIIIAIILLSGCVRKPIYVDSTCSAMKFVPTQEKNRTICLDYLYNNCPVMYDNLMDNANFWHSHCVNK